jgi:hypothetical protein
MINLINFSYSDSKIKIVMKKLQWFDNENFLLRLTFIFNFWLNLVDKKSIRKQFLTWIKIWNNIFNHYFTRNKFNQILVNNYLLFSLVFFEFEGTYLFDKFLSMNDQICLIFFESRIVELINKFDSKFSCINESLWSTRSWFFYKSWKSSTQESHKFNHMIEKEPKF